MVRRIETLKTRNVVLKLFLSLSNSPRFQCSFSLSRFASSSFSFSFSLAFLFLFLVLGCFEMAELPPDAELWLPSDILPDERSKRDEEDKFPSEFTYMEELAQQLSSYALLEQKQQTQTNINPSSYPNFQNQPIRIGSYEPNQTHARVMFGGNADIGGTSRGTGVYTAIPGGFLVEPKPKPPLIKPPTMGESYGLATGGRVLQQQQNRVGNRFLPFQGNGGGGIVRGTGVFLPRVETYLESRRKLGGLRHNENHCNMPVKRNSVGKKKEVGLKATSEGVDLPQEWTY